MKKLALYVEETCGIICGQLSEFVEDSERNFEEMNMTLKGRHIACCTGSDI